MKKLFLLFLVAVISFSVAGCFKKKTPKYPQVTLEIWGVFDDSDVYNRLNIDFARLNPRVASVKYKKIANNITDFENQILKAMANGTAPDIIYFKSSWLPKHGDKIVPEPGSESDLARFKQSFVDVAYNDFVYKNKIYAKPLYCDSLALYYNNHLLNQAGITSPPKTWAELKKDVQVLTKIDKFGNILQSGIALGRAKNPGAVNRASDILMLLMMQGGAVMNKNNTLEADFHTSRLANIDPGVEALKFFTSFTDSSKPWYSWNAKQDYSVDSFRYGRTAMMINYSYWYDRLKKSDPKLDFSIAPVPQTTGVSAVNYPSYWGLAVVKNRALPQNANYNNDYRIKVAWQYINFVTNPRNSDLTGYDPTLEYLKQTHKPPARRDLIDIFKNDVVLGPFAQQALTARSWRQVDNNAVEAIFNDMIDSVNRGLATYEEAVNTAQERINALVRK